MEREEVEQVKHTVSLKENHLFRRLYSKGKSAVTPTLAVYVRPNHHRRSRLGVTVGTKVGKAVKRNRVRRRIREAYRIRSAHAPYAEVERDLLRLLDKLGVYQRGKTEK